MVDPFALLCRRPRAGTSGRVALPAGGARTTQRLIVPRPLRNLAPAGGSPMARTPYDIDLDRNPANYQPLTPLTFLERAAGVFPNRLAVIHGPLRRNYAEFYARCRRLASALARHGITRGDTVAAMLANTPAMLEAHYGVPMAQAVLNTLNTRLDAAVIAFSLDHAEAKAVIVDREYSRVMKEALARATVRPLVIDYDDPEYSGPGERIGALDYETFIASGDPDFAWKMPDDEWDAITLNYTSGTTGDPKGVVYHHRGAYLLALGNVVTCGMGKHPVYLWTLPMFHCNGTPAGGRACRDEKGRLQRHPSLRPDRDLRPRGGQRLACRMGRAPIERTGGEEGAAGGALPAARGARRARSGDHAAGAARRAVAWRGHVPRQRGDEGVSQEPKGDREGLRRRLVPLRRSRRGASRRLHPAQGPVQGHHHFRRREHFLDRGGGCPLQASGRRRRSGGRQARREMGRDALRLRRAATGRAGERR